MFFSIIKTLCKLLGAAYIVQKVRERCSLFINKVQHAIKEQAKRIAGIFVLGCVVFMLFSLGLRFLLLGLAYWLNSVLSSDFLGFWIVSIFCFFVAILMGFMLRSKMNNHEEMQEKNVDEES